MIDVFQQFGFPVACVISLGMYIAKVQSEQRLDSKVREERLCEELKELSSTNQILLETNTVLVKEISRKLDMIMEQRKSYT